MRIFIKIVSVIMLISISVLSYGSPFSNMIVFGDSLSDIGNLPEDSTALSSDPSKAGTADVDNANYYIPVSSPIDIDAGSYFIPKSLTGGRDYSIVPLLLLTSRFQSEQPLIDGIKRPFHSGEWNEFFLSDAAQDGLENGDKLLYQGSYYTVPEFVPSTYVESENVQLGSNVSVNYAWSSALSDDLCHTTNWGQPTACDETTMINAWKSYWEVYHQPSHPSYDEMISHIQVPGLNAQVHAFLQDVSSGRVSVTPSTLYMLRIGGNDLAYNFANLEDAITHFFDYLISGKHPFKMLETALGNIVVNTALNNYEAMVTLSKGANAKNIYLINQFDASLTPRVSHWPSWEQTIGKGFVGVYNFGLKLSVDMLNKYYSTNAHLVDVHTWYEQMSKGAGAFSELGFSANLTHACELDHPEYAGSDKHSANCGNVDGKGGYMFWNAIHPAMPTQEMVGYLLEQQVKKDLEQSVNTVKTVSLEPIPTYQDQKTVLEKAIRDQISEWIKTIDIHAFVSSVIHHN